MRMLPGASRMSRCQTPMTLPDRACSCLQDKAEHSLRVADASGVSINAVRRGIAIKTKTNNVRISMTRSVIMLLVWRQCAFIPATVPVEFNIALQALLCDRRRLLVCRAAANRTLHWLTQANSGLRSRINQIPNIGISMGKYVVSPTTHPTDCGRFRASFSIRRSQSTGSSCRVFQLDRAFASREAARLLAVTQAWLQTCMPHPLITDDLPA